jgi:peptidyl-prolyl cis-trans isomerase SurA
MNRIILVTILFLSLSLSARQVIDKTLETVYTPEETILILQSDLRPGLDGISKTVDQVLLERLMLADAKKLKITVSDVEVDRYLAKVESQYKLTREQTKELFKNMGYTYKEGREQLRNMQIIEQIKEYRIKGKAVPTRQELEEYHKAHPAYQEASYTFSQGFVPFQGSSRSIKKAMIKEAIASGAIKTTVQWGPPLVLKEDDFAEDKAYIKALTPGSVAELNETDAGITLVHILAKKEKRLLTLDERIKDITILLGQNRAQEAFEGYKKTLLASGRRKRPNEQVAAAA